MSHLTVPRRIVALGVAAAAAVAALTGCASGNAPANGATTVLHVGELGSTPLQKRLLELAGETPSGSYSVDYALFPAGPALLEAVPSGAVDVGLVADTPAIFAQVGNVPVKVVGVQKSVKPGEAFVEIVTKPESSIRSFEDLRGKRVALVPATILQYTVVRALESVGLDYDDITVVELGFSDATAALQRGDVDAVATLDPDLSQLKASGAVTVGDSTALTSGYTYALAADAALADPARTAAVEDYLARVQRAQQWAVAHPDEWAKETSEQTGLALPIAQATVARTDAGWVPIDDRVIALQQQQADAYFDLGLIKTKLDVRTQYDTRFGAIAGTTP